MAPFGFGRTGPLAFWEDPPVRDSQEKAVWRAEQDTLWRLSAYALHLNDRMLEDWELRALLPVLDPLRDPPE